MFRFLFILAVGLILGQVALATERIAHPGYTQDVKTERNQRFYEVFLFHQPARHEAKLQDVIFNRELSKEFRLKYQERFGQLDTESIQYQKSNFSAMESARFGANGEVAQAQQRRNFAEFMVKRLGEWHLDNYFKSEPNLQAITEFKDQITHAQIAVAENSRVEFQYSLSGNTIEANYINPYLDSKWIVELDPSRIGPSEVQETRLQFSKDINSNLRLNSQVVERDGVASIEFVRNWKHQISTSLSGSSFFKPEGKSPRESRIGFGFSRSY